jgi:hypothetical protein
VNDGSQSNLIILRDLQEVEKEWVNHGEGKKMKISLKGLIHAYEEINVEEQKDGHKYEIPKETAEHLPEVIDIDKGKILINVCF